MFDAAARVLSGTPVKRWQLICAGLFIAFWFSMDFVQFIDWVVDKYRSYNTVSYLVIGGASGGSGGGGSGCTTSYNGYAVDCTLVPQ